MSFVCKVVALVLVAGLTSCTTAPSLPSLGMPVLTAPVPPASTSQVDTVSTTTADKIAAANAVYLARVERSGGVAHYIVTEIWRQDPAVGTPPEIGSEWTITPAKPADSVVEDEVLIHISPSQLSPGRAGGQSVHLAAVTRGPLVAGQTPLTKLRIRVASGTAANALAPSSSPTLAESLGATAIYLTRMEQANGRLSYFVVEVLRHRQPGFRPAVGAEIVLPQSGRSANSGANQGEEAIVFLFSPPLVRTSGRRIEHAESGVFGGNVVVFHVTLEALRKRILAAE